LDTVAAFDFDGTLCPGDSLVPFLRRWCGDRALAVALGRTWRHLARLPRGGEFRDRAKEALLAELIPGRPVATAEELARQYAGDLQRRLRADVLARLGWHQSEGHRVVIVSASPALYLQPLGDRLGVDAVLATRLVAVDGVFTGALDGANCRGVEKERRLRGYLGPAPVRLWAYGDSAGDDELLAMADVGVRVRKSPLVLPPA
jgi:phosphatidylglycerophosphatase C